MAINRRNILIGLGALVGGGGALVGTGAFTTVSAAREVSVSTAGDASAFLTIEGDQEYVTDNSGSGTLTIDLGGPSGGFNQEAVTTIQDVVTVTNNSADGNDTMVGVSTDDPSSSPTANSEASLIVGDGSGPIAKVTFYMSASGTNEVENGGSTPTLSPGDSPAGIDVVVDTTSDALSGESVGDQSLTIVAVEPPS